MELDLISDETSTTVDGNRNISFVNVISYSGLEVSAPSDYLLLLGRC